MTQTPQQRAREALKVVESAMEDARINQRPILYLHPRHGETIRLALTRMGDESHVYVPKEPTEEMIIAADESFNKPLGMAPANTRARDSMRFYNTYTAMINAAPNYEDVE